MGPKYNLSELAGIEELQKLKLELAPRNQCRNYVQENGGVAELLEKKEFDTHYKKRGFIKGPFKETFGDDYGEPYNPNRQAFGKLKRGNVVYCELSDGNQKKAKILLKKTAHIKKEQ